MSIVSTEDTILNKRLSEKSQSLSNLPRSKIDLLCSKFELDDAEILHYDFSCAIKKDILIHGRLYIFSDHLCFSSPFLAEKKLKISLTNIMHVEKAKVMKFINNAIKITFTEMHEEKNIIFCSFWDRNAVLKKLQSVTTSKGPTGIRAESNCCADSSIRASVDSSGESISRRTSLPDSSLKFLEETKNRKLSKSFTLKSSGEVSGRSLTDMSVDKSNTIVFRQLDVAHEVLPKWELNRLYRVDMGSKEFFNLSWSDEAPFPLFKSIEKVNQCKCDVRKWRFEKNRAWRKITYKKKKQSAIAKKLNLRKMVVQEEEYQLKDDGFWINISVRKNKLIVFTKFEITEKNGYCLVSVQSGLNFLTQVKSPDKVRKLAMTNLIMYLDAYNGGVNDYASRNQRNPLFLKSEFCRKEFIISKTQMDLLKLKESVKEGKNKQTIRLFKALIFVITIFIIFRRY